MESKRVQEGEGERECARGKVRGCERESEREQQGAGGRVSATERKSGYHKCCRD